MDTGIYGMTYRTYVETSSLKNKSKKHAMNRFLLFLSLIITFEIASAELAYYGFTGLINTPTAEVTSPGDIDLLLSNKYRPEDGSSTNPAQSGKNSIFSIGLLPNIELGGAHIVRYGDDRTVAGSWQDRLNWNENRVRNDLSGNVKIKIPLGDFQPLLPDIAVGIQDFAGLAVNFRTEYLALSKRWQSGLISLGYRHRDYRLEQSTKGIFAGALWKPINGLELMAEHEPHQQSVAVRLFTPDRWLGWGKVGFMASTAFGESPDEPAIGLYLTMPLGFSDAYRKQIVQGVTDIPVADLKGLAPLSTNLSEFMTMTSPVAETQARTINVNPEQNEQVDTQEERVELQISNLHKRLSSLGYNHFRIGRLDNQTLAVRYEEELFDRSWIEGLGVLLGVLTEQTSTFKYAVVRRYKHDIELWDIEVNLTGYRELLQQSAQRIGNRINHVRLFQTDLLNVLPAQSTRFDAVTWFAPTSVIRSSRDLVIKPGLSKRVGTEVGEYDYMLSLRLSLTQPLWKGAVFNLMTENPVANSRNYEPGKLYYSYRYWNGVRDAMLHQTFRMNKQLINMTSVGLGRRDFYVASNESMWLSETGAHQLRLQVGYYEPYNTVQESPFGFQEDTRGTTGLLGYRYRRADIKSSIEITAGQFLYQDRGVKLEMSREFDDTRVSLFYKRDGVEQAAGIIFGFPLSTHRSWTGKYGRVHGPALFETGLQTTILPDGSNTLRTNLLVEPVLNYTLEGDYYNNGRFTPGEITSQLPRMVDAYFRFGEL